MPHAWRHNRSWAPSLSIGSKLPGFKSPLGHLWTVTLGKLPDLSVSTFSSVETVSWVVVRIK